MAAHTEQPEHKQNKQDRPKHGLFSFARSHESRSEQTTIPALSTLTMCSLRVGELSIQLNFLIHRLRATTVPSLRCLGASPTGAALAERRAGCECLLKSQIQRPMVLCAWVAKAHPCLTASIRSLEMAACEQCPGLTPSPSKESIFGSTRLPSLTFGSHFSERVIANARRRFLTS